MDTKEVKVYYKKEDSKKLLTVIAGYGTQGECLITFPAIGKEEKLINIRIENTRVFEVVHPDIMIAGKYFPGVGKSIILISYTFTEDGKVIHKENIEKSLETFERFSHFFSLEKVDEKKKGTT